MLATQVAGGQAGDSNNSGSNLLSVIADRSCCLANCGSGPKAEDHAEVRKSSLAWMSASGIAGNRAFIQALAPLKLAR
jgi:hypothetical protein